MEEVFILNLSEGSNVATPYEGRQVKKLKIENKPRCVAYSMGIKDNSQDIVLPPSRLT